MNIYFARHGESQANLLHVIANRGLRHGLTPKGREQAAALAQHLSEQGIAYIYSSPVLRAIETSIILANQLNLEYEVIDALREYDCGILEGRSDEASWQRWQALFDAWTVERCWDQCIEGGETFFDIRDRFMPFIDSLVSKFRSTEARILCVSHGGVYRMMLPLLFYNKEEFTITHQGFGYTSCVVAELHAEGLVFTEWM